MLRGSVPSAVWKFGVILISFDALSFEMTPSEACKTLFGIIRPLGSAVISKTARLLFSLDVFGCETTFSFVLIMWNVPFMDLTKVF